jgi:carbon-monoxide dehydrogenase large subunit
LITGTQTIGQGHETTFPQILADRLGIPDELVRLRQGDTDLIATGGGHGSSRATYMGGTAIWRASETIVEKAMPIVADALEAAEVDIAFADGQFAVVGTNRSISLLDVATRARDSGTPLDTYHAWTREHMTFPNGTHVVEVEIDRDTGAVALVRHAAVDDYGVLVNPMIAAGQAHGAIAQASDRPCWNMRCLTRNPVRCWRARSSTMRCHVPMTCRHCIWSSTVRAAPPIRLA